MASIEHGTFCEFKVYDQTRHPSDWTSLVGPSQCAVFLKDVRTANPLILDGTEVANFNDCRFYLFDRLEDARQFCESQVQRFPLMCCDVFDDAGRAKPPMLTIMHPAGAKRDELSPVSVKRRKIVAIASIVAAVVMFITDWRYEYELLWPSFLAINLFFLGLRFLYWNSAGSERARTQAKRITDHLRRERESSGKSSFDL